MLDKGVAGQFGSVRKITARSLIGFSRFDVIQNSFQSSQYTDIMWWIFVFGSFQVHVHVHQRSPDDLGISIHIHLSYLISNTKFWRPWYEHMHVPFITHLFYTPFWNTCIFHADYLEVFPHECLRHQTNKTFWRISFKRHVNKQVTSF